MRIEAQHEALTASEQALVSEGFRAQAEERRAPEYIKERVKWLGLDERNEIKGILTADILWDWLYVDELWVSTEVRGAGFGRLLMLRAEQYAGSRNASGIWLWTQSWQAEGFYRHLGYREFARFEDFPRGHSRIGFRKRL